jgi:Spy/CpxP family protein refolding chaperone
MKTLALTLLAVFGLAAASPAMAFGRKADIGAGIVPEETRSSVREVIRTAVRHFLNFRKETPLSDDQKAAISKILQEHRPEIQAQITKGRDARRAMEAAAKENATSPTTKAAAEKIGDIARDRALLMARISAKVRPLLTAEQQKQIESARDEIESLVDAAFASAGR